jgi:CheY-like chemotaxis protein
MSTDAQLRFLIVEDTDEIRDLMARMVVRQGYVADEAADGLEAVAASASTLARPASRDYLIGLKTANCWVEILSPLR